MKNLILEKIIMDAINNLPQNNISVESIIEYIDFYEKIGITRNEIIDSIKEMIYKKINYQIKIYFVKILLNNFYDDQIEKQFENAEHEFNENKNIKNIIKEIIIEAHNDKDITENEKADIIGNSIILLAENTGCVEDTKIAENILNELFENYKIITQKDVDVFYKNVSIGRWL
jgi:hypothetical protein